MLISHHAFFVACFCFLERGRKRKLTDDVPMPLGKRRSVTFGPDLSPEEFALHLPPNTPVRRGASPTRRSLRGDHSRHSFAATQRTGSIIEESPDLSPKNVAGNSPSSPEMSDVELSVNDSGIVTSSAETPTKEKRATPSRSASKENICKSGNKTPARVGKKTSPGSSSTKLGSSKTDRSLTPNLGKSSPRKAKSPGLTKTPTMSSTPAKAVVLRAIYGKDATPKLPPSYFKSVTRSGKRVLPGCSTPVATPKSTARITPRSLHLKTTPKSTSRKDTQKATPKSVGSPGSQKSSVLKRNTPNSAKKQGTPKSVKRRSAPKSGKTGTPKSSKTSGTSKSVLKSNSPAFTGVKSTPKFAAPRDTPKTARRKSVKKTPKSCRSCVGCMSEKKLRTWADIVKKGVPAGSLAKNSPRHAKAVAKVLKKAKVIGKAKVRIIC